MERFVTDRVDKAALGVAGLDDITDGGLARGLLYSSDLELGETTKRIFQAFEQIKPERVVLDSLSEIRLLAQSSLRYRRQILALKHYFAKQNATVLLLDDLTTELNDRTVDSVAHGVIHRLVVQLRRQV